MTSFLVRQEGKVWAAKPFYLEYGGKKWLDSLSPYPAYFTEMEGPLEDNLRYVRSEFISISKSVKEDESADGHFQGIAPHVMHDLYYREALSRARDMAFVLVENPRIVSIPLPRRCGYQDLVQGNIELYSNKSK